MLKKNILIFGYLLLLAGVMLGGYAVLTSLTPGLMEMNFFIWIVMSVIYFLSGILIIGRQFGNPNNKQDKPEIIDQNQIPSISNQSLVEYSQPLAQGQDTYEVENSGSLRQVDTEDKATNSA